VVSHRLSTIDAAVEAIRRGEIVIVMDAEDRENEGDFICAAEKVTPKIVNFMITHGRGQLCMPLLPDVSKRLDLPPMVDENTPRSGQRRSWQSSIRRARRSILCVPGTFSRWWPRRAGSCGGPDIPRPRSI
jgi:3,4-dihydroxy-2-butanone 4-phosphate synthase